MEPVLEVKDLRIHFRTPNGILQAVRDISFSMERGKTPNPLCRKNNRTSHKSPRHCEPVRAWQSPSFLQEIATSGFALLAMTW